MKRRRVIAVVMWVACLGPFATLALAATDLERIHFSTDVTAVLGSETVSDELVASDDLSGTVTVLNPGMVPQRADLMAFHLFPGGERLFSLDVTLTFSPGGLTANGNDVVHFDGATHSLAFNGEDRGIPAGVGIDAVSVFEDGDLLLSFDVTTMVTAVTVDDEDLVRVNDFGLTLFFDGSAAGVDPGLDLDAAHYITSNGHLLLSFDGSGSVGGENFDDEDVLEYDPVGGTWEMLYDGSVQHQAGWPVADLDAVHAEIDAPEVVQVLPEPNSLDVSLGTNVYIIFSEPVSAPTVEGAPSDPSDNVKLYDDDGVEVLADVSLSPSGLQATLDPAPTLKPDTTYTIDITSGVQDTGGTPGIPFTSQFQTGPVGGSVPLLFEVSGEIEVPPSPLAVGATPGGAPNAGWSVALAGDLNDDGFDDFLVGQPGLQVNVANACVGGTNACEPCTDNAHCDSNVCSFADVACSFPEAGAAIVYFGGPTDDREKPRIIFHGRSSHARVGAAVAGGFDFNLDGTPDLLIGAEEVNRSGVNDGDAGCNNGDACGPGAVYLIYFDLADYTPDPNDPDVVSVTEVNSVIDGVVIRGVNDGDLAELSLDGGGPVHADAEGADVVIGAPRRGASFGAAYVIFNPDDPENPVPVAGDFTLDDVGCVTLQGREYANDLADDRFGNAAVFAGDVTGGSGIDLAIGAPGTDVTTSDEGAAYVIEGGSIACGSQNTSTLTGPKIVGSQSGEELGYSVAAGGDNRVDERDDLLIGAPHANSDAGRVIQTSAALSGTLSADVFGTPGSGWNGRIWEGETAGDRLGHAVTGVGDVTRNNWDDIVIGAPFATPNTATHSGIIYLIDAESYTNSEEGSSTVPISEIGITVAGLSLAGQEEEEFAGFSVSAGGRLDQDEDDTDDFLVGAPGRNGGEGRVYIVLDSIPDSVGNCSVERGCEVRHLDTGAQIEVPPGTLADPSDVPAIITVIGAVGTETLDETLVNGFPENNFLAGAADFDEEDQGFSGTGEDPILHIPIREDLQDQLLTTEKVYEFSLTAGWEEAEDLTGSPIEGSPDANPQYTAQQAVKMNVRKLRAYAVFFKDLDGDEVREEIDCNDSDETLKRTPAEIQNVQMLADDQTLEWDSDAEYSGSATTYEVLRGVVSEWPVGSGASEVLIGTTVTTWTDFDVPDPETAFYYLVRGTNGCPEGVGTWGFASDGCERGTICP